MTYIFYNGDVADGSHVNDNFNKLNKLTNEKAINDVSATNSGVLAGSSQVLIDKFLDSTGQNNTVDTGNTTAFYNVTNKYLYCYNGASFTDTNETYPQAFLSASSTTQQQGFRILANSNCYLKSITKTSTCTATRVSLFLDDGTLVDRANFSGNVATFATAILLKWGNYYKIRADNSGGSYTRHYVGSGTFPNNFTNISYISMNYSVGDGAGSNDVNNASNISVITTNIENGVYSNSLIQSTATTIPTGMTKVFVTPLMYEALATGDSITADVSIDNGAHYTTGVPINTWTPITSANGTQLIVKANLLTGSGVSTPKISGWRVLME